MIFRRIMFIVNPASRNGKTEKAWAKIEKRLRSMGKVFGVQYTGGPCDAIDLTRNALRQGYNCIVAVGGDGTVNEVVNGFYLNQKKINENAVLTAVPMGTGSDLSRIISLKGDINSIASLWHNNVFIACDLVEATFRNWNGDIESRFFINIADLGLGSETVVRVNRNSKSLGGFISFLAASISSIINLKSRTVDVTVDGIPFFSGLSCMVAVANGKFFGGGMMIAPHAEINDGLLDVIILEDFAKIELIRNLPLVYQGNHLTHPKVSIYRGREVEVNFVEEVILEMDGEAVGVSDVSFKVMPGDIKVLVY